MAKALVTPPTGQPVTLAQAKAHLKIETNDEDGYLQELIAAAVATVEAETGKALLTQTWRLYLDDWPPCGLAELPVAPVRSVGPVNAYAAHGTPSPIAAADYLLDRHGEPPRIYFRRRPDAGREINGIEIDIVAGYGEAGTDVPDQLVRAVLILVAHWHAHRGAASDAALMGSFPKGFRARVAPFRQVRL
jgi:uncharacterized phiE125 gp8 family phage protein